LKFGMIDYVQHATPHTEIDTEWKVAWQALVLERERESRITV